MHSKFKLGKSQSLVDFLGIEFVDQGNSVCLHQKNKIIEICKENGINSTNNVIKLPMSAGVLLDNSDGKAYANPSLYRSVVSKLLYLSRACRLDIYFSVIQLSRRT